MGERPPIHPACAVNGAKNGRSCFGPFELNLAAGELRKSGLKLKLHGQPLDILALLLERPGEVVTRDELQQQLWVSDTIVDFEHGLNKAINRLREALGDDAANPRYIETLPRVGYRFIGKLNAADTRGAHSTAEAQPGKVLSRSAKPWKVVIAAAVVLAALAAAAFFYVQRKPRLTAKDPIVLADFTNRTGDPVFDGTLRQGLAVQLEQSPLLRLLPEEQIQQTLRMMKQPPDAKLTPEIAQQICQRTNSTTVLNGSVAQFGTQYSLILRAESCVDEQLLASTEEQAKDKSHVLEALGKASANIRKKLGESATTLQKFDTPLEQATTSSLEALQAYSLGFTTLARKAEPSAAIPLLQQAVRLDPSFAMPYVVLSACYHDLGETTLASENARKAFDLRSGVSERERLLIEAAYCFHVTGDLRKGQEVNEVRAQTYSNDPLARLDHGLVYAAFGQYDKSLAEIREATRLYPGGGNYDSLVFAYIALNRLEEARAAVDEAKAKNPDFPTQPYLYVLAFLQKDTAAMDQQVTINAGTTGAEGELGWLQAGTAAYSGQLQKARGFYRQAVVFVERDAGKDAAGSIEAHAALAEALLGNKNEARHRAESALTLSTGRDAQYGAALALALVGDEIRAQTVADALGKSFPQDTFAQFNYLPTLRAQLALCRKDASNAVEALHVAAPYELGTVGMGTLYPVYVRGLAYLAAHKGTEAAAEFQKILDHRGVVLNDPIGALSHLELGRGYAMAGDSGKAMVAYQDFFTLWKEADPTIPILKLAKVEYTKLQ